jgi:hypothetical protein
LSNNTFYIDVFKIIHNKAKQFVSLAPMCVPEVLTVGMGFSIRGINFGTKKGYVKCFTEVYDKDTGYVRIEDRKLKILEWNENEIRCKLSDSLRSIRPYLYNFEVSSEECPFMVIPSGVKIEGPQIHSVEPTKEPTGNVIVIQGKYFSNAKGKLVIGDKMGRIIDWKMDSVTGDSEVRIFLPKGIVRKKTYDVKLENSIGENVKKRCLRVN